MDKEMAEGRAFRTGIAILVGVAMLFGAALVVLPQDAARAPAAFDIDVLEPAVASTYRHAAANMDVHEQVPCYCGCDAMLGHRHLGDCFVTPDGGWDSHAAGCDVCLGEARQVEALMNEGMAPPAIRERIIADWGASYGMEGS